MRNRSDLPGLCESRVGGRDPARRLWRKLHQQLSSEQKEQHHFLIFVTVMTLSFPPCGQRKDPNTTRDCELFVQKIPGRRKRREPTCHFKASWRGVQVGRWAMSVEQEGGGVLEVREEHNGAAGHLPQQCGSFITRTPPCPKALCVPWPFIRPRSEWSSSCVERRVLERPTPLRGPAFPLPTGQKLLCQQHVWVEDQSYRTPFPNET